MAKKIIFISIAVLVFGFSLWAYTMSYASIDISPDQEQIIPSNKPVVSVDWPYAVGADLKEAKVFLDGKDISSQIKIQPKGFTYRAPKDLPQGIHVINARLKYKFIVTKKINLKWFFTTDTVPPKIVLNERNNTLASRTPSLGLRAATEPQSQVVANFNNHKTHLALANKKGNFVIGLKGLKKKNNLLLRVKDRAGNITKRRLSIIIDTKPPVVKAIGPTLLFTANNKKKLQVILKDGESGVVKASLKINDKLVKTKYDMKSDTIAPVAPIKKDGTYVAQVDAQDVAGNKVSKKWKFKVDTSRIVVDQSDFRLYLYKNEKLVHTVQVAVGRPSFPTPNGNWQVVRKKANPSWYNPRAGWSASMPAVIPPGPSNPLGLRAMYLDASGIRIHGTSAYYSVGSRASHGCIRVRNQDVVNLFPKVNVGTPVLIRP